MWDLSSPTGDQTHTPSIKKRGLNHWTTRDVPKSLIFSSEIFLDSILTSDTTEKRTKISLKEATLKGQCSLNA